MKLLIDLGTCLNLLSWFPRAHLKLSLFLEAASKAVIASVAKQSGTST